MLKKNLFILPHTLEVNELPSHSHNMPGYQYGDVGTAYFYFTVSSVGEIKGRWIDDITGNGDHYVLLNKTADGTKRYRIWYLGGAGSPTTESGNNESLV